MYTTLTLWVIRSLNNTLLSLAPSPSVYISIHTHTQCFLRLPYISVSPPASLFLCYDHHGDFGAVGPCSQSLHYSAFSSRSACPSLCVSTACLNYSHRSHYWVHLFPPAPFLRSIAPPPSLKNHQGETGGLQGLGGGGTFRVFSAQWSESVWVPLLAEMNHSQQHFWGELFKASPRGQRAMLICTIFRLSCRCMDDQESTPWFK